MGPIDNDPISAPIILVEVNLRVLPCAACQTVRRLVGFSLTCRPRTALGWMSASHMPGHWEYSYRTLPRTTWDKDYFHHIYWKKFVELCWKPWLEMNTKEKKQALRAFIFNKWSLDPQRRCMLPERPDKRLKRNDACWHGFWLLNSEVDRIVDQVVDAYDAAPDAARRSTA